MIPPGLQKMFGLKDEKDVNMATNIWKMLDDMADSDPSQYKNFIQKNLKEGMNDAKVKKQQKQKPYRVVPKQGFLLTMKAQLNQKPLQSQLNQKVLITKIPWMEVRKKFEPQVKIYLNIAYSDRIKDLKSRRTGKVITKYSLQDLKDIQLFYYSLQGPNSQKQIKNKYYFCFILNSTFFADLMSQPAGKKTLLGLCMSYLQERLSLDKNPLLQHYNPEQYRRLAFYNIDKYSIEISDKQYCFISQTKPGQFLLEKEVDKNREKQIEKQLKWKKDKQEKQLKAKIPPQIKFKVEQKQEKSQLQEIKLNNQPVNPPKKVLIQVLKQEQSNGNDQIVYQMKQTQLGYSFQFLLNGVASIQEVDLQMKMDFIKLKVKDKKQLLIKLNKPINDQAIKAKFKKKISTLTIQATFK